MGGESQLFFQLDLQFDDYPEETSWNIADSSGSTVLSGSNYFGFARKSITETSCLAEGDCYEFTLLDEYGDGICCDFGSGDYNIFIDSTAITDVNPDFSTS